MGRQVNFYFDDKDENIREINDIFNSLSSDAEGDKRISKKSYESLQEMVNCLKEF